MVTAGREKMGAPLALGLFWLLFEFGRPPTPPGIPLLIAAVLFLTWVGKRDKQLGPQTPWWFVLLGVAAISIPIAPNWYSAFFATRLLGTLILGVCLPLQSLMTSVTKVRWWVLAFLAVTFYVGAWGATHRGFGPSGSAGAQDENYVAALMCMGVALAYFSLIVEKNRLLKLGLIVAITIFVAAIAVGENPSRGGFLGLIAVGAYCWWRSPKKMLGLGVVAVAGLALIAFAGPAFWAEIETSGDYETGTGDVRLELWKMGLKMWVTHPLIGIGAGNYRWVVGDYQSAEQMVKFHRNLSGTMVPHSLPIELLSEFGTIGFLAAAILVWYTWKALGKLYYKRPPAGAPVDQELFRLSCYADAIRAAILAVVVNGLFLSLLYFGHLWVTLAVGSALPFIHRRIRAQRQAAAAAAGGPGPAPPPSPGVHYGRRRHP